MVGLSLLTLSHFHIGFMGTNQRKNRTVESQPLLLLHLLLCLQRYHLDKCNHSSLHNDHSRKGYPPKSSIFYISESFVGVYVVNGEAVIEVLLLVEIVVVVEIVVFLLLHGDHHLPPPLLGLQYLISWACSILSR